MATSRRNSATAGLLASKSARSVFTCGGGGAAAARVTRASAQLRPSPPASPLLLSQPIKSLARSLPPSAPPRRCPATSRGTPRRRCPAPAGHRGPTPERRGRSPTAPRSTHGERERRGDQPPRRRAAARRRGAGRRGAGGGGAGAARLLVAAGQLRPRGRVPRGQPVVVRLVQLRAALGEQRGQGRGQGGAAGGAQPRAALRHKERVNRQGAHRAHAREAHGQLGCGPRLVWWVGEGGGGGEGARS